MKSVTETRPIVAAVMMLVAMSVIGMIDNLIPRIAEEVGLWQFHVVRSAMALPIVGIVAFATSVSIRPKRYWAVILRSVTLSISMLFYFSALAIMPIAEALAGLFTSPIFILLISVVVLRQRIGPWRVFAVALGFLGTLLVLQPDSSDFDHSILLPVAGGFFYACSAIITRQLCAEESTLCLLAGSWVALGLLGLAGLALVSTLGPDPHSFAFRAWVWPMSQSFPYIVVQAVGAAFGVFLIIRAYQIGEPTYVSVFEYSVMIFGPAFAFLAFGVSMTAWQIVGLMAIACSGAVIAYRS